MGVLVLLASDGGFGAAERKTYINQFDKHAKHKPKMESKKNYCRGHIHNRISN